MRTRSVARHVGVLVLTLLAVATRPSGVAAQARVFGFIAPMPTAQLKQLFPRAAYFTPRGTADPPYFTAYAQNPATVPTASPIGWAFWTIDVVPEERGYHGHIHMLVGLDRTGHIPGVIMDQNTEPYGDVSINLPTFPAQFAGKSIRDHFVVGDDVDLTSRATISVRAAATEIRESARRVARVVLSPRDVAPRTR